MIIFYSGSDTYRLRLAAARHQARQVADASQPEGREELERALKYPSFLDERTSILVRNPLADAESAQAIYDLCIQYRLADLSDVTLLMCQEGTGGRDSTATRTLKTYLAAHAQESEIFEPLTGTERVRWMQAHCTSRGATLSSIAASTLIQRGGNDSWVLANELDKLCAYASGEEISPDMVRLLSAEHRESDDFQLSNALAAKNKRSALAALWSRLQSGTAEPLLLGLLAYSVRTLLVRGTPYRTDQLLRTHAACAALDRDAKSGRADMTDGLFNIILQLS